MISLFFLNITFYQEWIVIIRERLKYTKIPIAFRVTGPQNKILPTMRVFYDNNKLKIHLPRGTTKHRLSPELKFPDPGVGAFVYMPEDAKGTRWRSASNIPTHRSLWWLWKILIWVTWRRRYGSLWKIPTGRLSSECWSEEVRVEDVSKVWIS